eukprot:TRINITY_DN34542_c0_g1_i1.p1 TRINITY_DN34542_c0_g1~~TRINITY_DN34542_c0_g1_i1.p1  ORF type:complete len:217 (-),score=45.65 TRINITY_DN34542_c0_g1_i1:385-1035(-)
MSKVWFYVPNLIGYARVVLAIASFYVAFSSPLLFVIFYMTSFLLDAADGYAARTLHQSSRFGAVLDMVTDRMATAGFVLILSHLPPYNQPTPRFLLLCANALDLCSHWYQMYASLASQRTSHKGGSTWLTRLYYSSRPVLAGVCLGQEVFYFALYAAAFEEHLLPSVGGVVSPLWHAVLTGTLYLSAPVYLTKQVINLIQLGESCAAIVDLDSRPS